MIYYYRTTMRQHFNHKYVIIFFNRLMILLVLCVFVLSTTQNIYAQDTPEKEEKTEEKTEEITEEPKKEVVGKKELTEEEFQKEQLRAKLEAKNKKPWYSAFLFWKRSKPSKPAIDYDTSIESLWHADLYRYMGVVDEEFYKFGYARKGAQWYPITFIRRFKMMKNQYEHTLIIRGKPEKIPRLKGITIGPYGVEVTNEGFEYQMPTVASVSRQQKSYDEEQSISLVENRLISFGFEEIKWVSDRKRDTKDLADTWTLQSN